MPVHLFCFIAVLMASYWWRKNFSLGESQKWRGGPPGLPEFFDRPHGREMPGLDGNPERRPPPPGKGVFHRGHGPNRSFDMLHFLSSDLPIYLMILAGAHTALFFKRDQERAASLAKAKLEALRMQLQPHFLFNTLNTIAGLVHEEPDKADAMLTSLGSLLRLSLETSSQQGVPLGRELDFIKHYLDIMRMRFEERLVFELDAAPETRAALVPPMLLYALAANVIEHGIQHKVEGGLLTIRARRKEAALHLTVTDNASAIHTAPCAGDKIGLGDTAIRLRELYGSRANLLFYNDGGITAALTIPFQIQNS